MKLTPIFNQYLRHTAIPKLEWKKTKGKMVFRWKTDETKFNMPVDVKIKGKKERIYPTANWKTSKFKINTLQDVEVMMDDFYINVN